MPRITSQPVPVDMSTVRMAQLSDRPRKVFSVSEIQTPAMDTTVDGYNISKSKEDGDRRANGRAECLAGEGHKRPSRRSEARKLRDCVSQEQDDQHSSENS